MDIDTALLRALAVLAEELHFGRAAQRLQITQQAMSKRIAQLEARTGLRLVDRSDRRSLRLTADGARVTGLAREVLDAVDRLPSASATPGRLVVDVMDETAAPMHWARRASRSANGPAVEVITRAPDQPPDALLRTGQAQLAFGRAGAVSTPWPAELRRRLVLLEPLSVLVPHTHAWAALDQIPLGDLRGSAWWFPMTGAPVDWRDFLAELSRDAGVTLDMTGSTFGYHQWAADVSTGAAPPSLLGEEMAPPPGLELRTVPIVDPVPVFPWWLLWHDVTDEDAVTAALASMGLGRVPATPAEGLWLPAADARLAAQSS